MAQRVTFGKSQLHNPNAGWVFMETPVRDDVAAEEDDDA